MTAMFVTRPDDVRLASPPPSSPLTALWPPPHLAHLHDSYIQDGYYEPQHGHTLRWVSQKYCRDSLAYPECYFLCVGTQSY
ncbi:hypothetical protein RB195_017457 [Necator americanus]|uniref:Uncharacterized protein n=1 Tax=Necator americanus TaxID=51031 RepID=A0ABR1C796_NECAM